MPPREKWCFCSDLCKSRELPKWKIVNTWSSCRNMLLALQHRRQTKKTLSTCCRRPGSLRRSSLLGQLAHTSPCLASAPTPMGNSPMPWESRALLLPLAYSFAWATWTFCMSDEITVVTKQQLVHRILYPNTCTEQCFTWTWIVFLFWGICLL